LNSSTIHKGNKIGVLFLPRSLTVLGQPVGEINLLLLIYFTRVFSTIYLSVVVFGRGHLYIAGKRGRSKGPHAAQGTTTQHRHHGAEDDTVANIQKSCLQFIYGCLYDNFSIICALMVNIFLRIHKMIKDAQLMRNKSLSLYSILMNRRHFFQILYCKYIHNKQ